MQQDDDEPIPTPRTGDAAALERFVSSHRQGASALVLEDAPGAELVDAPPSSVRASEAGEGGPDEATVEEQRAAA